jgi:hypothetical protein
VIFVSRVLRSGVGSQTDSLVLSSKCHAVSVDSELPRFCTDDLSSLTTNSRLLHDLAANHGGSLSQLQGEALSKAVHAAWTLLQMVTSEHGVSTTWHVYRCMYSD